MHSTIIYSTTVLLASVLPTTVTGENLLGCAAIDCPNLSPDHEETSCQVQEQDHTWVGIETVPNPIDASAGNFTWTLGVQPEPYLYGGHVNIPGVTRSFYLGTPPGTDLANASYTGCALIFDRPDSHGFVLPYGSGDPTQVTSDSCSWGFGMNTGDQCLKDLQSAALEIAAAATDEQNIDTDRQRVLMNAAMHQIQSHSHPPSPDSTMTIALVKQKQKAIEATQATKIKQRMSADMQVSSQQVPSTIGRRRSLSHPNRSRIPLNHSFDPLNEHLALHPLNRLQSQPFHSAPQSQKPPGAFESSLVGPTIEEAPQFDEDETQHNHNHHRNDTDNEGTHIDYTVLDITRDYELNLNTIVTNALRQKSNSPIKTLEQSTALDAEDFATSVAKYPHQRYRAVIAVQQSHLRAEETIDDLSDDINVVEHELQVQRDAAQRRRTRLAECQKIIDRQQDTMGLQQTNIASL
ncbi:hypothetical protein KCU73_g3455, partial [Aureobasidium melanogenum]